MYGTGLVAGMEPMFYTRVAEDVFATEELEQARFIPSFQGVVNDLTESVLLG